LFFRMVWGQPVTAPAALSHRGAIARGGGCHGRPHTAAGKTSQNNSKFSKTLEYPVQNQRWHMGSLTKGVPGIRGSVQKILTNIHFDIFSAGAHEFSGIPEHIS
jgi:hypothetical protein